MTELDKDRLRKLANLARLDLDDEHLARLGKDLERVVSYVQLLDELDLDDVEPLVHPAELKPRSRPDEAREDVIGPDGLEGSAGREGDLVRVPKVIPT